MKFELADNAKSRISRDLAAFADTRSEIIINGAQFSWTHKRELKSFEVLEIDAEGMPKFIEFRGNQCAYVDFFSSEEMASLGWLADEINRSLSLTLEQLGIQPISTKVRIDDQPESLLFQTAISSSINKFENQTSLVFLQGRAGDGKSTSLMDVARTRADLYAKGASTYLYLYIDAQGRSLSRLDEAVALILDDLNANFRYQALAVLTRLGLVVPIVDGFDELLGAGGYVEAFASLESFLFRLDGRGTVITSARATFYQQSALVRAAARFSASDSSADIGICNIRLQPWGREETEEYLRELQLKQYTGDSSDSSDSLYEYAAKNIGAGADEILSSPLLTAAYVSLLKQPAEASSNTSIVEAAIRALVRREIETKLLGAQGQAILDENQFEILFSAIAEEMWWQETRTVDDETLKVVAELTLQQVGLPETNLSALLGRLTSNALIDIGENSRKLSFRHEIYFSYFLGSFFLQTVLRGTKKDLRRLLSRSQVSHSLARQCAWLIKTTEDLDFFMKRLGSAAGESVLAETIDINRGSLISSALKNSPAQTSNVTVTDAFFSGADFSATKIDHFTFSGCRFFYADFSSVKALNCVFDSCVMESPLLDNKSEIDFSGLIPGEGIKGIRLVQDGEIQTVYRIAQNPDLFKRVGIGGLKESTQILNEATTRKIDQVEKILRFVGKSMYFSEEDFRNRGLQKPMLDEGARHGLWVESKSNRRGNRAVYTLAKTTDEIAAGALGQSNDTDIEEFWKAVLR
jgi:uncharacterized protein YjbI with pentapeptide repeats